MKKRIYVLAGFLVVLNIAVFLLVTGFLKEEPAADTFLITVPEGTQAGDLVNLKPCSY